MTVDTDLSTPLAQVRAIIGDTSSLLISDQTINALLLANSDNVNLTAIQCLQFIVADLAKRTHEEVGDVEVWGNQLYEQYKKLLDDLLTNPAYALAPAVHILGGVNCSKSRSIINNSNSRRIRITEGFSTRGENTFYDPDNPFFLTNTDCGCDP